MRGGDIRIGGEIMPGIEIDGRIAAFLPAEQVILVERVDAGRRNVGAQVDWQERVAGVVLARKRDAAAASVSAQHSHVAARAARLERAATALAERRTAALAKHTAALFSHDPERTLERGYALLLDESGEPLGSAAAVREAGAFTARMADADVRAKVDE